MADETACPTLAAHVAKCPKSSTVEFKTEALLHFNGLRGEIFLEPHAIIRRMMG
jgi:NADPH-dependent ferric siderophore reductase